MTVGVSESEYPGWTHVSALELGEAPAGPASQVGISRHRKWLDGWVDGCVYVCVCVCVCHNKWVKELLDRGLCSEERKGRNRKENICIQCIYFFNTQVKLQLLMFHPSVCNEEFSLIDVLILIFHNRCLQNSEFF